MQTRKNQIPDKPQGGEHEKISQGIQQRTLVRALTRWRHFSNRIATPDAIARAHY